MGKIDNEKRIVKLMVELYCRKELKADTLPEEYAELIAYAHARLDRCRFGEKKTSCKRCPIHCYARPRRELMRKIMRWAGPRMLWYEPKAAIAHMLGR